MRRTLLAVFVGACVLLGSASTAQKASKLERLLDAARNGSPVVRPQAAERLVAMRAEAAPLVLELLAGEDMRFGDLGAELIEVLGRFDEPALREHLWSAVDDEAFPWRPAAARGLSRTIQSSELTRAARWGEDNLASVRVAGIQALGLLDARSHESRVRSLLFEDPDDRVRREAATLFDRWGKPWALAWIVEELDRTDRFFDADTGRAARFAAIKTLETRFGRSLGIRPELRGSAPGNQAAFDALRAEVKTLSGGRWPKIPAAAKVGAVVPPAVIGVEVRSCRTGEFFLRFSADDRMWVGAGANPLKVALRPGTVAGLVAEVERELGELNPDTWGQPGCDVEQFYLRTDAESPARVWRLSKGADPISGLRPVALGRSLALIASVVPEEVAGDAARARLLRAFESVGGSVSSTD